MQKKCKSYAGYSVNEHGEVFTHRKRFGKGRGKGGGVKIDWTYQRKLDLYKGHEKYLCASISTKKGQRSIPIHTILLDAFIGPRPKNLEIRHLDGNPMNNKLSNLCYGTRKENALDRVKHNKSGKGMLHPLAKLTNKKVVKIRSLYNQSYRIAAIARQFNIGETTVRDIVNRKSWTHI